MWKQRKLFLSATKFCGFRHFSVPRDEHSSLHLEGEVSHPFWRRDFLIPPWKNPQTILWCVSEWQNKEKYLQQIRTRLNIECLLLPLPHTHTYFLIGRSVNVLVLLSASWTAVLWTTNRMCVWIIFLCVSCYQKLWRMIFLPWDNLYSTLLENLCRSLRQTQSSSANW